MRALLLCGALSSVAVGCGAQTQTGAQPTLPIELELKTAEGGWLSLSDLRGRPTLLFLFATYDSASQLLWSPLTLARNDFPDLQLVAVALQPDAERLLPMYGESLGIRDPLASDEGQAIRSGQSALGAVDAIPTLVLLGPDGRELSRRTGGASAHDLRAWLADYL